MRSLWQVFAPHPGQVLSVVELKGNTKIVVTRNECFGASSG